MDLQEFREVQMDNEHIKKSNISPRLEGDFIVLIKFHCRLRPEPSQPSALDRKRRRGVFVFHIDELETL